MYLIYGSDHGQSCAIYGWTVNELLDTLRHQMDDLVPFMPEEPYIVFLPVNKKDWEALGNES